MTTDTATLRQFIMLFFNDDELEDLCADYFADVAQEFTIGMTKSQKARLLIGHVDRRGRREHLLAALAKERPAHYTEQLGRAPTPVAPPPTALAHDPRRVFISHAHQDAATARRLAADLAAVGRPVWIAPDSILPGEQWVDAIGRGLEMSGVFVLLLSPEAVASNWVRYETSLAIALERRGLMDILPLDWQPCEPPIPWQAYQYLPFRTYEDGVSTLLARLKSSFSADIYNEWLNSRPDKMFVGELIQAPPDRRIHEKTGIELIRIPAGPFIYGSADSDEMAFDVEKPQRTVVLPEYWIGRTPVTNIQFAKFVRATGYETDAERSGVGWGRDRNKLVGQIDGASWRNPEGIFGPPAYDDHPVVLISKKDAMAFCEWAGLRLPIEQEWEKAARGTDGRIWPWGNEPPTERRCNFNDNIGYRTPVERYSTRGDSPYGCVDMAGNVWELTASWFSEGKVGVLRGCAWYFPVKNTRAACRHYYYLGYWSNTEGFRVAEQLSDLDS